MGPVGTAGHPVAPRSEPGVQISRTGLPRTDRSQHASVARPHACITCGIDPQPKHRQPLFHFLSEPPCVLVVRERRYKVIGEARELRVPMKQSTCWSRPATNSSLCNAPYPTRQRPRSSVPETIDRAVTNANKLVRVQCNGHQWWQCERVRTRRGHSREARLPAGSA